MKHLRYLLAMLCLAIGSTAVRAYDLVIDGIYYNILSMDDKTVEVAQAPEGSNYSGPITISGYAITGGVMFQVVGIGNNAFSGSSITSISLPNSVKTIGHSAFWACNGLTSIDFGSTAITTIYSDAFGCCYNLTSVTLPSTVTSIDGNPFRGCYALDYLYISGGRYKAWDSNGYNCNAIIDTETSTLVSGCKNTTIPDDVTTIGYEAFNGCSSLTSITIPNSVTTIGYYAFNGCGSLTSITIPASVTSIGYWAFTGCNELTSITVEDGNPVYDSREDCNAIIATGTGELIAGCSTTVIPSGVTRIGEAAFSGQYHLNSIVIPEGVTSIGYWAFCNGSLSEVTLPISLTYIDNYAFTSTNLTTVNLNCATPPTMEQYAFYDEQKSNITLNVPIGCASLYTIADQWSSFGSINATLVPEWYDFKDGLYYTLHSQDDLTLGVRNNPYGVTYAGDIVIPNTRAELTVDAIDGWAFYYCQHLASVDIPESVTSIGDNAFYYCNNLSAINFPSNTNYIGTQAFSGCNRLTALNIPANVTGIGEEAFTLCTNLESITVDDNNGFYDSREGCNALIETTSNRLLQACNNTFIPEGIEKIGSNSFAGFGLSSISIPSSVYVIGSNAFSNCGNLRKVVTYTQGQEPTATYEGWVSTNTEDASTSSYTYNISVEAGDVMNIGYSVSSERGYDWLTITVDGEQQVRVSGEVSDCYQKTFSTAKTVTIEVEYSKDGSASNGNDQGTISFLTLNGRYLYIGAHAFVWSPVERMKVYSTLPAIIFSDTFTNRTNATLYVPQGARNNYLAMEYWQDFQQIKEYPDHDVNQDGEVDVVDVVDIARYVVGTPRTEFEEFLADVTENNRVNVNDAVAIVNEIVGNPYFVKAEMAPTSAINDQLTLAQLEEDGSLSLQLSGSTGFTAFQMNLHATEAEVEEMVLNAERKNGQKLLYNKVEEGVYRIAALSTSNRTLRQSEGEVLNIRLDYAGADDIRLTDILFVTPQGQEVTFPDLTLGTTTAIRDIATEDEKASGTSTHDKSIYDLNGRRLQQTKHGLNIVGGKKVVVK